MGFLGSIGKALGGVIKQVAPALIKAVAPMASKLLGGIAGDIFQKGAGFLKGALSALPLPGPLKAIGEKLLGQGLDKLTQFAQGGIDKLIQSLGDMVMKRLAPGVGNIALPGMATPERQAAIQNNSPTASSSAAASAAPTSASSSGVASGGSGNLPPAPLTGDAAKDIGKQNEYNAQLFDYQQRLANMNKFWEMMSTVQKSSDSTKSQIIGNMRA